MTLDCTFQYFLRRRDLKLLHDTYDVYYKDILRNNAIDELKGATKDFSTRDFGEIRADIEKVLFNAIKSRLEGDCCKFQCENSPEGTLFKAIGHLRYRKEEKKSSQIYK